MKDEEMAEEREIDNCLIMRIKKLKEQVKNLIQQVIGSCILAFIKNKREKQDEQTTYEKAEKYAISQKHDDEQAQLYIIDGYLKGAEELKAKEKQLTKVKYTLKKIIETVQNDRIDEYGARLVLIKDFAYECLQEIE